jgi:LmbE family N-acetylglucosaminyl deacetylase
VAPGRAVADLGRIIERVQPDTIVTFGPDGITGHPDHRAVSAWTTAARQAHRPAAQLWYATLLTSFHDRWGPLNDAVGIFPPDAEPPRTDDDDATAIVRCDEWQLDAKLAALRAHRSQTAPLIAEVGEDTFRSWWSVEAFIDAAPVVGGPSASPAPMAGLRPGR